MTTCRAHGLPMGAEWQTFEQCQSCDWCPVCERVTEWEGEVCLDCGGTWGESRL